MSNISQASKNIKKKLSFEDYSKPSGQKAVTPAHQHAGSLADQQDHTPAIPHDSIAGVPVSQLIARTVGKAGKQVGRMAQQKVATAKTKATFYLSEEDNQALTDIFIKRLQEKNKTDKSALISEAINLLINGK